MIKTFFEVIRQYGSREIFAGGIGPDQFRADIERCCAYWSRHFDGIGHHVGILADNSYLWIVQCFGVIASGNVVVTYNQNLPEEKLVEFIEQSDTELMICDAGGMEEYPVVANAVPMIEMTEACLDEQGTFVQRGADDVILMMFSSGTSGVSKIVQFTNRNMYAITNRYKSRREPDGFQYLVPMPMYHVGGVLFCFEKIVRGNSVLISSPKYLARDMGDPGFSAMVVVPAMLKGILEKVDKGLIPEAKIKQIKQIIVVGAPLLPGMDKRVEALGIELYVFYGLTETTGTVSDIGPYREGASSRIIPGMEVKILDGEVVVRSEKVVDGYYKNQKAAEEAFKDGWFYTGDTGWIDDDGYLYISGRKKNIIILSNGENVNPEELEFKLYKCPLVSECRVFGEGDQIKAEIYTQGESADLADRKVQIEAHVKQLNQNLAFTHRIQVLIVSDQELEKTATGKIKRF